MKNQSQEEIWKDIKGYGGQYQVSSLGRVRRVWRYYHSMKKSEEKILKIFNSINDYGRVNLLGKKVKVHLLVWQTFDNTTRDGRKLQVDHIDEDKTNNAFNNLQLLTSRKNKSKERLMNKGGDLPTGVCFDKSRSKYVSHIYIKPKLRFLGRYCTVEEASRAYQNALCKLGEAA